MRIALIHDWLTKLGGAERVLIAFHRIFPEAPIYTLFYNKEFISQCLPKAEIISSFLQRIPGIQKFHPWLKVLMPLAIESLDLSGFDLVISSSHEFSHGVIVKPQTKHICYYHSPSRLLWDRAHEYVKDFKERGRSGLKLSSIRLGQHFLRLWDCGAGKRPDLVIANSEHVAERIKKYYSRESKVIYPPCEKPLGYSHFGNAQPRTTCIQNLTPVYQNKPSLLARLATKNISSLRLGSRGSSMATPCGLFVRDYFLIVSQLYPHKNVDLAVEVFKNLPGFHLIIIGEGPEKRRLQKLIGKSGNIKLLGFVPDEDLANYYQNCLAYLIVNEEDFGIAPIEAMSFGKPVLAYRKGGAEETVLEGITGKFFGKPELESLAEAIKAFTQELQSGKFNPEKIKKHSQKFHFERFRKKILALTESL